MLRIVDSRTEQISMLEPIDDVVNLDIRFKDGDEESYYIKDDNLDVDESQRLVYICRKIQNEMNEKGSLMLESAFGHNIFTIIPTGEIKEIVISIAK